jgi:hypothetical protein
LGWGCVLQRYLYQLDISIRAALDPALAKKHASLRRKSIYRATRDENARRNNSHEMLFDERIG